MPRRLARTALTVGSAGLAVVLLLVGVPKVAGTDWAQIIGTVEALPWPVLLGLGMLWLVSLWMYAGVLTASLPGLTRLRALMVNTASSAVSNLLPFGGAAGLAVTFVMARSWGHTHVAITSSALVTGIWNTIARLVLPAVGLAALLVAGIVASPVLTSAVGVAGLALAGGALLVAAIFGWASAGPLIGRVVDAAARLLPGWMRPAPGSVGDFLTRLRSGSADVIRTGWRRLTLGMIGFLGMEAVLFYACLLVTGGYPGWAPTLAAFALSRALATVVLTPGGLGISELGTTGLLVGLGAPPGPAVVAVLLFTLYVYALEIPTGAVSWCAWAMTRHRRSRRLRHGGAQ